MNVLSCVYNEIQYLLPAIQYNHKKLNRGHTIILFVCHPRILRKHCLQFLLGVKMTLREIENNAYAKFWSDKQRPLWDVMVFSGVVNYFDLPHV